MSQSQSQSPEHIAAIRTAGSTGPDPVEQLAFPTMASWQWFGNAHRTIYRMSRGRIGANLAGRPMLLLTTIGRRSREPRTTPLSYLRDGDDCIVVASNNGSDRHPAWWLNLEAHPEAQITVGREAWPVEALVADSDVYTRLWPRLLDYNPQYAGYKAKTERVIPVVILRRRDT